MYWLFWPSGPIVINTTSYMLEATDNAGGGSIMGGNGLALVLMVIGFIVAFLVPIYALSMLF